MDRVGDWYDALIDEAIDHDADAALRLLPHTQRARPGVRPSPNLAHWHVIGQVLSSVSRWHPSARVHVDVDRRARGQSSSKRRPDLQFRNPVRRRATHIEVDTQPRSMLRHIQQHLTSDPMRRGVFLLVDPATGAVIEKRVIAAGSTRQTVTRGTPANPVPLTRDDVFDDFEDIAGGVLG